MSPEDLKALMNSHGLNVKRTAGYAGVSSSCIYMWLRGERNIPRLQWENLQRVLNAPNGKVLRLGDTWEVK